MARSVSGIIRESRTPANVREPPQRVPFRAAVAEFPEARDRLFKRRKRVSRLVRQMFGSPVRDVYCGLRGFAKHFYQSLDQRCTGMEFATEMIIKAAIRGAKVAEIPAAGA